jgi:hypothetical protein
MNRPLTLMRSLLMALAASAVGGVIGAQISAYGRYIAYPALRYDVASLTSEVLSFGAVLSALFTWLICLPAIALFVWVAIRIAQAPVPKKRQLLAVFAVSLLISLFVNMDLLEMLGIVSPSGNPLTIFIANALVGGILAVALMWCISLALGTRQHSA